MAESSPYFFDPVHAAQATAAPQIHQPHLPPPPSVFEFPPPPLPQQHRPMPDPLPAASAAAPPMKPKGTRGRRKAVAATPTKPDGAGDHGSPSTSPSTSASANAPRTVNIKTKFPVARIKRIMQADEDVGKVAQVTPVVVSKALELFMIALCDKASDQARQRNSKRITAGHLKQAIVHEDQFDFLVDIIEKIPDIPVANEPSSFPNGGDNSEDCAGATAAPVKKTRKPRQRKPKDEDLF